jgi:hypothetical protein
MVVVQLRLLAQLLLKLLQTDTLELSRYLFSLELFSFFTFKRVF